jgi:formate C-acetyltransferase
LDQFPVVKAWRKRLFDPEWIPEVCDELPRLYTDYVRRPEAQRMSSQTRRANALKHVFSKKTPIVKKTDLLPGQTTTSFVGPVMYPDASVASTVWPELKTMAKRPLNPFKIRPEVAERLNKEIFPYWLDRRVVHEAARYSDYDTDDYKDEIPDLVNGGCSNGHPSIDPPLRKKLGETPKCQELMERVCFYLMDKYGSVSHTVPDFERMLKLGLEGLIAQMRQDIQNKVAKNPEEVEFLDGVITVFEGAIASARHLAEEAEREGNTELARICRKVPAQPAETLHEALTAVWICYHLLLQENTNFGFSIGRLDQVLNPYYLADWEKPTDPAEKQAYVRLAVELVCHFFLHCSDHVPLSPETSETMFAGSGSNQALTVGGTRYENGRTVDAVNDMTYIILKATELLAIRDPNVHARYHKDVHHRDADGNPLPPDRMDPYLERVCQVNIVTRATPAIHGDAAVIPSMVNYYRAFDGVDPEEALADAHDYASIGCIEQNSAGKHYGNTGSTLLVLPAVLELALFGGKHRSIGIDTDSPNLFHNTKEHTTPPLTQMKSMNEFIEVFRKQLDDMARHTVQCNNYLGRFLRQVRPSPLLSGLFVGPTNVPGGEGATFKDLSYGGAKYNSAGVAVIGLADVIDSFCTLDALVFGGKMSVEELLAAMDADFDVERASLANGDFLSKERLKEIVEMIRLAPKYGAGVDQTPGGEYNNEIAVKYTHLLTKMIQDVYFKYRTHRGGRYLPGYWSMTNHAGFGMLTRATPNGRRAGLAFASGITPCAGIVKANGDPVLVLDHILSVVEVDPNTVQNGYTYNLSLTTRDRTHFKEDNELFVKYMKTFLDHDGVLVQLCVTSIKDFEAAHKAANGFEEARKAGASQAELDKADAALAPYKDLMIRVAGYSAYYVTLSPEMRREIIRRSNFDLVHGQEQHTVRAFHA